MKNRTLDNASHLAPIPTFGPMGIPSHPIWSWVASAEERSKYNALKHGLFAKVVLLGHAPKAQFEGLLQGLQHDLMPKGMLEMALVEKLATNLWRYRRFLQAERAVVDMNIAPQEEHDEEMPPGLDPRVNAAEAHRAETDRKGALADIDYPGLLEFCLEKFYHVREIVDRYGLDRSIVPVYLGLVYGAHYLARPGRDLFDYYLECRSALKTTATERERRGFKSEVDCGQKFITEREKETRRLEGYKKRQVQMVESGALADEDQPGGANRSNGRFRILLSWIDCCAMRRVLSGHLIVP